MGKKTGKLSKFKKDDFVMEGNDKTYLKERVVVSFKPIKKQKILPAFNMDKKPFTPAFFIPILYSALEDQRREKQFENRIAQADESSPSMLIPRPKLKSFMCCRVCRRQYDDYQQHILSEQHKKSISESVFNKLILEMCTNFQQDKARMAKQMKQEDHQTEDGFSESGNVSFKKQVKVNIKEI